MTGRAKSIAVVSVGFALYRFAATYLYGSGLGMHQESVGFVSDLGFVLAMNAASCLVALACLILLRRRRPCRLVASPFVASLVLLVGVVLGSVLPGTGLLAGGAPSVISGVLCGTGLFMLCVTWLDVMIGQADAAHVLSEICIGSTLYTAAVVACDFLGTTVNSALAAVALLLSAGIAHWVRRPPFPDTTAHSIRMPRSERYFAIPVYACFFVLVGVVGIMHTSVLGSSSEYIIGAVPMWLVRVISLLIFLVIVLLMGKRLSMNSTFKVAFPVFIVVMTLLPFMGEMARPFTGLVATICYCVCGMLFNLFNIREGRRLELSSALLACVYTLGSSGCLLVGLCIGLCLNAVSASFDLSLLTLLAFVAIYPLALVFIFLLRRDGRVTKTVPAEGPLVQTPDCPAAQPDAPSAVGSRGDGEETRGGGVADPAVEALPPSRETFERTIGEISTEHGLTRREREILSHLALGRSARYIAETLVISENTVWTHVKRIYAKTKTHGKDELMGLVGSKLEQGASR